MSDERLKEATALLWRVKQWVPPRCGGDDIEAFLASRAPAQPAAPTAEQRHYALNPDQEDGHESPAAPEPHYAEQLGINPALGYAAPEPSADKDWRAEYECCWRDCELWHQRAESAEAQLAAVRYILSQYNDPGNEMLGSLHVLQMIDRALTPAPSPGAGEHT